MWIWDAMRSPFRAKQSNNGMFIEDLSWWCQYNVRLDINWKCLYHACCLRIDSIMCKVQGKKHPGIDIFNGINKNEPYWRQLNKYDVTKQKWFDLIYIE